MLTLRKLLLLISLLDQTCAFSVIRGSCSNGRFFEGLLSSNAVDDDVSRSLAMFPLRATSKENDEPEFEDTSEETEEGEMTQELLMKRLGMDEASQPSGFDAERLPLPLFSSLVIFIGSTVLTLYGLYIGIVGFPDGP